MARKPDQPNPTREASGYLPTGSDPEQHLVEFDGLLVLDEDLGDDAAAAGRDLVEELHGLDRDQRSCRA